MLWKIREQIFEIFKQFEESPSLSGQSQSQNQNSLEKKSNVMEKTFLKLKHSLVQMGE